MDCSSGTYIRKLGEDIAEHVGTVGHVEKLKRTQIGDYRLENAISIDNLDDKLTKTKEKLRELALVS